jgi:hypothetical protein
MTGERRVDHRGTYESCGIDGVVHTSHTESEGDCCEHLSSAGFGRRRRGTAH